MSKLTAVIGEIFKEPFKNTGAVYTTATTARGITDTGREAAAQTKTVPVSSYFKLIFISVLLLTVLAIVADIVFAMMWEKPTPNQQTLFDGLGSLWKAGGGAILGLLGGKAT
jgi:hypothetical protein